MEKLNKAQTTAHTKDLGTYGKIDFQEEIRSLKEGESLKVMKSEWVRKSTPYQYYYQNINWEKPVVRIVTYNDYYLIIKL